MPFFGNLGPVVIWFSYYAFKQNPPLWMFPLLPYKFSNISDYWLYHVSIIECLSFITKKKIYKKKFWEKDPFWWPKNTKFPFFLSLNIWDRAKHYTVAQKTLSLTISLLASTEKDGGDSGSGFNDSWNYVRQVDRSSTWTWTGTTYSFKAIFESITGMGPGPWTTLSLSRPGRWRFPR